MARYKIEREAGRSLLVINGQKEQQISEREFYCISTGQIDGLVRAEILRKSNGFKLMYDISGLISLREFLYNPMDKAVFCRLFGNILKNLKNMQNAFFNQQYLLLELDSVMINPLTQAVSFIYVPITFYENVTDLKGFLLDITEKCSFIKGENTSFIGECRRILNSGINFSLFELEEFISGLSNTSEPETNVILCKKCGEKLSVTANFCSVCGHRTNEVCIQEENIYDPLKPVSRKNSSDYYTSENRKVFGKQADVPADRNFYQRNNSDGMNVNPPQPIDYSRQGFNRPDDNSYKQIGQHTEERRYSDYNQNGRGLDFFNQTNDVWSFNFNRNIPDERNNYSQNQFSGNQGYANNHFPETSVLWSGGLTGGTVNYAELVNVRSGERVSVQKDILTIGKDSSMNDFCIRNNAVSRTHARIRRVGGRWYISDLNSTNKTYLNGSEICPNVDIELFSNTKITFANEEFIFIIH